MDNFKAAGRSLLSTPGPALVIILTLAIAIGANTAIFSVIESVLLRPLGYGDDRELVVLWSTNETDTFRLSPADYRDVRDEVGAFGGQVALSRYIGSTLTGLEQPVRVGSMAVTPRLFTVLESRPALGQLFGIEDETPGAAPKVVITHASWRRRFGADPAIIGSTIEVDGTPRTVVGVTEPGFQYPPGSHEVEVFFPMALDNTVLPDRNHRMFDGLARLSGGITIEAAQAELTALAGRLADEYPSTNDGWGLIAKPLRLELFGDLSTRLWVLSAAVFIVLLIACANIANLLVARSATASKEFAVRSALGAGRADLCKRSLAESLILGLLGGAGGLMLAFWGSAVLRTFVPDAIPRAGMIGLHATSLIFAAGLAIGSTVLFGSLPALRGMAPDLSTLLNSSAASATATSGIRRLRELMVVGEVALAIVLLVSAGLMVRSFRRVSEVDPGFRQGGVVSMGVQLSRSSHNVVEWRPFFEQLVERVAALPEITAAGAVSDLPMSDIGLGFQLEFEVGGTDVLSPSARPNADFRLVVPGYFEAMGMQIVRGRPFDALDAPGDRGVVIVNETVVERYSRNVDPIGRTITIEAGQFDIIGVVSDMRHGGLLSKYESEIFLPYGRPMSTNEMHIVVQSDADAIAVAAAVREVLGEMDPQLAPSQVVAISDLLWESVAQPRFNTALLTLLAICGAVLAVMGTYGIVAFSVSQRAREIGLRMALGADAATTVAMIVRHALGIVLAGAIFGMVAALGATQFLSNQLIEVQTTDPLTYGIVLAAAILVGLLAAWVPARRATRIDPIAALRDG
jgi:putative ABC transport system permease protein